MKKKINIFALLVPSILLIIVLYFIMLPPMNLQSMSFYYFIIVCFLIIGGLFYVTSQLPLAEFQPKRKRVGNYILLAAGGIVIGLVVNSIIFSPIFQADRYSNRITIVDSDFQTEIEPVNVNSLPLLDKDSTERIGDRVMGEIPELISQFIVSNEYTQINQGKQLVRVTPLEYADVFKWFFNKDEGIPGYIRVDSTTGVADFMDVQGGINYSPSALLFKNLAIHLRLSYPTLEFGSSKFEVDDGGHPYWVTPVIQYTGIGMLTEISGAILTNASTGANQHYSVADIPEWVDNVYPANLIITQIDDWGTYQGGFINSKIGQKDVKISTSGYTYLTTGDDVSLYTGITSATQDQSNIGFVLVNLRTKEAEYYPAPGAEEVSAMRSAEGAIQEKSYVSTFPLLTNVDGRPTYLLSLKDQAGLVKAYALVDVADYQKVVVTDSNDGIEEAINNYRKIMGKDITAETEEKVGAIEDIQNVVIDGQTYYYLKLVGDYRIYKANITVYDLLPFIKIGSQVEFKYREDLFITEIKTK